MTLPKARRIGVAIFSALLGGLGTVVLASRLELDLATATDTFTMTGAAIWDRAGLRVETCDANGDGIADLVVGADQADGLSGTRFDSGEAWLVLGQRKRWQGTRGIAQSAVTRILGRDAFDSLGRAVACGDLNGDGFDDLVLGAIFGRGAANSATSTGEAHIVFGRATWPATIDLLSGGSTVIYGESRDDLLGDKLSVGDLNADGTVDLVVGARNAENASETGVPGRAYLLFGRATWPSSLQMNADASVTIFGPGVLPDFFGENHAVGDLDADGTLDLVVGAASGDGVSDTRTSAGDLYLFRGRTTWPTTIDLSTTSPDVYIVGANAGDLCGSLRGIAIGSVSLSGQTELFLGARYADGPDETRFDSGEFRSVSFPSGFPPVVDLSVEYHRIGYAATSGDGAATWVRIGEINGSPPSDLVVSVTQGDGPGETRSGAGETVAFYGGASVPLDADFGGDSVDMIVYGKAAGEFCTLKALADLNDDGFDEVVVAAWLDSTSVKSELRLVSPYDSDGDGLRQLADNCPLVPNASQLDTNSDERGDACQWDWDGDSLIDANDCAPANALGGTPGVVSNLRFALGSKSHLIWDLAPFGQRYEVTRGSAAQLSISDYGTCLTNSDPNPADLAFTDNSLPAIGEVFTYLVQARNLVCGQSGTLGTRSNGTGRVNLNPARCE